MRSAQTAMALRYSFGEAVKNARLARGWTQEQLAVASNFPRTYISAVEHGHKVVTIETAQCVALALGMPLSALLSRTETLHGGSG